LPAGPIAMTPLPTLALTASMPAAFFLFQG
jgi:hypothetical protein